MSTPEQEQLAKKLIAVLGRQDAIELVKHIPDHPTDPDHKISDLLGILDTSPQKQIEDYLNSGIGCIIALLDFKECKEKGNIAFEASLSPNCSEEYPQVNVGIVVPKQAVLVAELSLGKIKDYLRKLFRADSFPIENASLGKVVIKVKSQY